MSNRKGFKVTEEEYKFLERMKAITKEDKQRNRLKTLKNNNNQITKLQRSIDARKEQIKDGMPLEKHELFLDGAKPLWYVQNDIDTDEVQIEELKEMNQAVQEEYDRGK